MEKFHVINSIIGLKPISPAPTPIPVKPVSVIGVSMILSPPNSSLKTADFCSLGFSVPERRIYFVK